MFDVQSSNLFEKKLLNGFIAFLKSDYGITI